MKQKHYKHYTITSKDFGNTSSSLLSTNMLLEISLYLSVGLVDGAVHAALSILDKICRARATGCQAWGVSNLCYGRVPKTTLIVTYSNKMSHQVHMPWQPH